MQSLLIAAFLLLATSVAAEEVGATADYTTAAHIVVTLFGVLLALRLAAVAFARPPLVFAGVSTEPRYLTSS
jgi:hypothetical protein